MNNQQLIAYPQDTTEPITYPTGEVVLDLFKDEPIPLTLNVDDFTNVAEADASYSKSFEIPGTKNNNLFFNHIYDITSDSNFNPHKKTKIIVKEGSIDTFSGYMQLNDILHKNGAITYDITLYSEAVNLKDILSERILRDIDLEELEHIYNEDNIEDSWTGGLVLSQTLLPGSFAGSGNTTSVVKYPLVRWNNNSSYNASNNKINTSTLFDLFRPFLNVKYLLQKILSEAGYSFTSNFINSTDFNKLYIDLNRGSQNNVIPTQVIVMGLEPENGDVYSNSWSNVNFTGIVSGGNGAAYYDTATNIFTATNDNTKVQLQGKFVVSKVSADTTISARIIHNNNTYSFNPSQNINIVNNQNVTSAYSYVPYWNLPYIYLDAGETIQFQVKAGAAGDVNFSTFSNPPNPDVSMNIRVYDANFMNFNDTLTEYKGEINQWDLIKDFIDLFKLVVIQDENNPKNLIIEPYKDWIDSGNLVNLTNKVDDTEIKYTPIDGLAKNISFKFIEDTPDWITINHNKPNDWKYSYNFKSNIELIDKDDEVIQLKEIAATQYSLAFGSEFIMPYIIDEDFNDIWNNKTRLLYDNGVKTNSTDVFSVGTFNNKLDYLLFSPVNSHPISSTNSNSYNFGVVNYEGAGGAVLNSLYNVYWIKYIDELYHKDTRIVKIEAYLNADDISKIKFNDIILIKNKKFRIHKIEYRAGAMSKLELITIKDL